MSSSSRTVGDVLLDVRDLAKTYRKPFTGKTVEAVRGVTFDVKRGEIFGFLGPNGAGKTTTIKMLTGLIRPTRGSASILGVPAPSPEAMGRVGFLPENPYVYPYLTPREFVTLCARLTGVEGRKLDGRVAKTLERLGVSYAMDRAVRTMSKGMLQRVGLAAALVHEPEFLILDEPMSGLDPVGRKEVRDLIVEERKAGRTVFFSSHILSDVELLCDRMCILKKGQIVVHGALAELVGASGHRFEVTLRDVGDSLARELGTMKVETRGMGRALAFEVEGDEALRAVLEKALAAGAKVEAVQPKRETLEDVFVRRAL
jgi:ABC-2 type transport system ATP-binding protein